MTKKAFWESIFNYIKSKKSNLIQIQELLEEISQLDQLITLHTNAQDRLMVKQYEARKRKFFDELVALLLANSPSTEMPPAVILEKLMRRFYPKAHENQKPQPANENILRPFVSM